MPLLDRSTPPDIAYKKIDDAVALLQNAPDSSGARLVVSALRIAKGRMQHLERRLGETETLRDRIAMQVLLGILERGSRNRSFTYAGALERAFNIADLYLVARSQGSAGAPGETTSPDFSENGACFMQGEKVRSKVTGCVGTVASLDSPTWLPGYANPEYTQVHFAGPDSPTTVCETSELERVQP